MIASKVDYRWLMVNDAENERTQKQQNQKILRRNRPTKNENEKFCAMPSTWDETSKLLYQQYFTLTNENRFMQFLDNSMFLRSSLEYNYCASHDTILNAKLQLRQYYAYMQYTVYRYPLIEWINEWTIE